MGIDADEQKMNYLNTLGVVAVLLISIIVDRDFFDFYTYPVMPGIVLRVSHSICTWSLFFCILTSQIGLLASIRSRKPLATKIPSLFYGVGVVAYWIFMLLLSALHAWNLRREKHDPVPRPPPPTTPLAETVRNVTFDVTLAVTNPLHHWLAFFIPQMLITFGFIIALVYCEYKYKSDRENKKNI